MAHTHEYDCKVCGAHLDSREDLDRHNREHHQASGSRSADQSRSASSSSNSSSSDRSSGRM